MPTTTLTYPAGTGLRFAAALGKAWDLKDEQGQPRNATVAECKQFIIQRVRQLINDVEGAEGEKARGPFVVPGVEMT